MKKIIINFSFFFFAIALSAQVSSFMTDANSKKTTENLNQRANMNVTNEYKHFILYGQSLATGNQSYPSLSVTNVTGNYMIGDQVWINYGNTNFSNLNPLVASMAIADVSTYTLTRNSGRAECPLIGAVNHIQTNGNNMGNILATSAGTGGKSIEQLSKESKQSINYYLDYTKTITKASEISKNNGYKITCPAIIWMQGEYNYTADNTRGLISGQPNCTDKSTYKNLLIQLKNNMQTDVMNAYSQTSKPLFITYQVGAQFTKGKTLEIGMAQLEMANEYDDVFCAGPVYQMSDRGGHLDANGYRWYGEIIAKAYLQTINTGKKFQPLQPKEIARTANPKEIIVKFLVPKLPLVLDILTVKKVTDYGFTVYNNDIRQTISSVTIDNDCVRLICSADLTGKIEIVYAGLNTTSSYDNGHGNLRDSDDYPSIYNYINLDKKNADNSYFYPREASETTLHPIYEPKDSQGAIYDKPYPLYNFSVAFYYKLDSGQQTYTVPNVDDATGLNGDIKESKSIHLYQSGKNIVLETQIHGIVNLAVYDVSGKLVDLFKGHISENSLHSEYNLSLSKGIYIVKATIANKFNTIKIAL